jgi:hypothetical protein
MGLIVDENVGMEMKMRRADGGKRRGSRKRKRRSNVRCKPVPFQFKWLGLYLHTARILYPFLGSILIPTCTVVAV